MPGQWYTYIANFPGGHKTGYTYQWSKPANWGLQGQSTNTITLSIPTYTQPNYGVLSVSVYNTCGTSPYCGITVYPGSGCYQYSLTVSPNPASSLLTVALVETGSPDGTTESSAALMAQSLPDEYTVEMSTDFGQKIVTQQSINGTVNINTASLRRGLYILRITHNDEVVTKRILLN